MKLTWQRVGWVVIWMVAFLASGVSGETLVWDGGGDGAYWYDPCNWNPNSYPEDYDHRYVFSSMGSMPGGGSTLPHEGIKIANGGSITISNSDVSVGSWRGFTIDTGTLTIQNGAEAWGMGAITVGNSTGSNGNVIVEGLDSTIRFASLAVGVYGTGTAIIANGAQAPYTSSGYVGGWSDSNGTVIVDGPDSMWVSGIICVGREGTGMLAVQNDARNNVTRNLGIGYYSGADGVYELSDGGELRIGGTVHVSRTSGDRVGPPYPSGEFLMNGGTVLGTIDSAHMIAHGSNASIIGPGTYNIKVTYESDPCFCDGQTVDVTFGRNRLLVGGNYDVNQLAPADFADSNIPNLLESSVFEVSFDGSYSDSFNITIPYLQSEIDANGGNETALMVFRETGPETYEQLDIVDINLAGNNVTAQSQFFGKFAVATGMIETIDPEPVLMDNDEVIADPEKLGSKEVRLVSGLIADGVTPVVIRAHVAGAGTVEFSIKDENGSQSEVGFLSSPGGSEQVTTLTVDVNELNDGRYMGFAILTAPAAFMREPNDASLNHRPITIEATFDPSGDGNEVISSREIKLVRPPVIMVHGLWSDESSFSVLRTELGNNGFIYDDDFLHRCCYNNSGSFAENDLKMLIFVTDVLKLVRQRGYACRKVDVVGHSMGGLLAKRIPEGFGQQNVRKIITIGSPYLGSPLADLLYGSLASETVKVMMLEGILNKIMHTTNAITGGAIEDLRCDDNPNIPVPTHISGVDCQNIIVGLRDGTVDNMKLNAFITAMCFATRQLTPKGAHDFIFGPSVESDWIVSESSQQGGEPNLLSSPVAWHCTEAEDTDVLSRVLQALNLPAQTSESALGNPALRGQLLISAQEPHFAGETAYSSSSEPNGTVEIVEPNEGQTCVAGQSITVSVQGTGDTTHASVFAFFGSSSFGDIVELPWQDDLNVPEDCVGSDAQIIAIGLDNDMNMTDQDEVNLILDSNIVLEDIIFGFGDEWIFDFKTYPQQSHEFQLYPIGVFSDDSEHPLSVLSEEKEYQSYNETVATLDPNGLMTVHSRGTAVVAIKCSSKTTTLIITVETYPGDLNLSGSIDYSDVETLADQWLQAPSVPTADIAPSDGDGVVNMPDFAVLANNWLEGL